MEPRPPALDTAAAMSGVDTPAIGAWMIGSSIPSMRSNASTKLSLSGVVYDSSIALSVSRISSNSPPQAEHASRCSTRFIQRLMRLLTRLGYLVEEQGMSYLADPDPDHTLGILQAAACTYRIAFGPRAGQKVLSLSTAAPAPGSVIPNPTDR